MRPAPRPTRDRLLAARAWPLRSRGRLDGVRQVALFVAAYAGYEAARGLAGVGGQRPFADATRIIELERSLHVFSEPVIQRWVTRHAHWLLDVADLTYLNAHFALTAAALVFIYLRRNDSFYLVRNMFMAAMLLALLGYCVFPTAPPRLMPQWGFSDSVRAFTGVNAEQGAAGLLLNPYAAVPSMHVCFALMIALPMSRLVHSSAARALWRAYPLLTVFAVVVTGNHYFTDVLLGALTAAAAAALGGQPLASARRSTSLWAAPDG